MSLWRGTPYPGPIVSVLDALASAAPSWRGRPPLAARSNLPRKKQKAARAANVKRIRRHKK